MCRWNIKKKFYEKCYQKSSHLSIMWKLGIIIESLYLYVFPEDEKLSALNFFWLLFFIDSRLKIILVGFFYNAFYWFVDDSLIKVIFFLEFLI